MKLELDCRKLKESKLENLKQVILENGLHPSFCVIQVGDVDASNTYIRNKINAAKKLNIDYQHIKLGEDVSTEEVIDVIKGLNESSSCDGIFVQLPLPESLDKDAIINSIDVSKDVDGLTDLNIGRLTNKKDCLVACTPKGIMSILENLKVDLKGKKATIISRSSLVGLPLIQLLLQKDMTVCVCHSKTSDLKKETLDSDVLITACGTKRNLITADMVKEGAIVIDVAIIRGEDGKLYGDVDYDEVSKKACYVTPVPGGVGQLTVVSVMENVVLASMKRVRK